MKNVSKIFSSAINPRSLLKRTKCTIRRHSLPSHSLVFYSNDQGSFGIVELVLELHYRDLYTHESQYGG